MLIKHKFIGALLATILSLFIGAGIVTANDGDAHDKDKTDQNVTVAESEIYDGALYAGGQSVLVAGTVKGDVYCAAQTVTVTGTVNGDLICAAQNIRIDGTVTGDVRVAAQTASLGGTVNGSATVFAQSVDIGEKADINSDLTGAASSINLVGNVGRDVLAASETFVVSGTVGRNVGGEYDQLTVLDKASVGGALRYTSNQDATIASGTVKGEVARTMPPKDESNDEGFWAGGALYFFFSTLLIALVIVVVAPRLVHAVTDNGVARLLASLLVGFFVLIGMPIVFVLLAITVVGLPLAGLAFLAWLLLILLSGPVFGYYLGRLIMQRTTTSSLLIMLVGSSVLILSYFVPFLNVLAVLAAGTIGSGMIALALVSRYKTPQPKVKTVKAK